MTALAPSAPFEARLSRFVPSAAALTGLIVYLELLFAPQILNDGDTYWHIRAGEWMLAHGQVLHVDVFTYTYAGRHWQTHEWLAEVVMALAYRLGGWGGVMALTAGCAAVAGAVVAGYLRRWLTPLPLTLGLVLGLACLAPGLLARPHVFAFPLLAAWTVGLLRARDAHRAPSLWLLPLMVIWANVHGSFVLGLALIGPFALEALIEARERPWPTIRAWGLFGLAALAASVITPHGVSGLIFPFELMSLSTMPSIDEWRPFDFSTFQPMTIALFAALFIGFWRGIQVPPIRLIVLLGLFFLALQHQRHGMVLGLLAPMLLAQPMSGLGQPKDSFQRSPLWVAGAVAALIAALTGARLALPHERQDAISTPASALASVPAELAARPVLNDFGFGGYLIWSGVKPFTDGRADMYGDAFMTAYDKAVSGDRPALEALLARYGVAWTIFHPDNPAVGVLDHLPGWRRHYADAHAVVHVRAEAQAMSLRGALR